MFLSVEVCRLWFSIRVGRWEFFAQPKSSPGYDTDHDRGPFGLLVWRLGTGLFMEAVVEVPFIAFHFVRHRL